MILLIESVILCLIFTIMVYIISKDPIKTLYNYPTEIIERVKSLKEYKNKIPTKKNTNLGPREKEKVAIA